MRMVNPINHGSTPDEIKKYKIEPYVIAADVYAVENHGGMGGWTWYTGSAGWMYQLLAESFFGLKRNGNRLGVKPCIPESWNEFEINYRFTDTMYHLKFERVEGDAPMKLILDDIEQESDDILLVNDKMEHEVKIRMVKSEKLEVVAHDSV
jgi:cellobiose phosphorylase